MNCFNYDWWNLLTLLNIILFMVIKVCETKIMVFDQIETDARFYYGKISKFPTKLATIEYTIRFNKTSIELYCLRCIVRLDIYTGEDDQKLMTNCSNNGYGQQRNENLHTPLYDRGKLYRFTTCKLDKIDSDFLHCEGRTTIQDYISRRYGFSFGYHCQKLERPSLHVLWFNFTIFEQTNKTGCIKTPNRNDRFLKCHQFYSYTSLPNLIGDLHKYIVQDWMYSNAALTLLGLIFSSDRNFFYKYINELVC